MSDQLNDIVSAQYDKWTYPAPIHDLDEALVDGWDWFDPCHASGIYWPDRAYKPDMDILIAGSGSNQAAIIAYNNRGSRVVGIDVSQRSLDHERFLKDKHGLTNLELHRLPIEEVSTLGQDFDLIMSTGVLHHLADPAVGMKALANHLRPDGVVALMLYARYGRIGVEMMQSAFRDLGLRQDDDGVATVKAMIDMLDAKHPFQIYRDATADVHYDAGLVDTCLHGRDRSFTTDDCMDLLNSAGLVFQRWLRNAPYYPHDINNLTAPASHFYKVISALPDLKMWSIMERFRTANSCHYFVGCHADRPKAHYAIDFSSTQAVDYVPRLRLKCRLNGAEIHRPHWAMTLNAAELPYVQHINGQRTIREIAAAVAGDETDSVKLEMYSKLGRTLFRSLWRLDFIEMSLEAVRTNPD